MSNTLSTQRYLGRAERFGNALLSGFDRSMLAITNFVGPKVTDIISGRVAKGVVGESREKNTFSESDINNISLSEGRGRYRGYTGLSLGDLVAQENPNTEMNWGVLLINKDGVPHIESFVFSEGTVRTREIYELLTILKLVRVHGSIALHESSPIEVRSKILGALKAHGITWSFAKKQWNETGVYTLSQ